MRRNIGQEILAGVKEMTEDVRRQDAKQLALLMLKVRRLNKMISTYYKRMLDNQYPDKCVRGYFNHCSTETGRLTSDMQQVPKGSVAKVKRFFVSRYK